jgi:4'-phosphopantetheinyl transferase EntD
MSFKFLHRYCFQIVNVGSICGARYAFTNFIASSLPIDYLNLLNNDLFKELQWKSNNIPDASDFQLCQFVAGRMALRTARQAAAISVTSDSHHFGPVLNDKMGRLLLPQGTIGSISHKSDFGVAVALDISSSQSTLTCQGIGIDIEHSKCRHFQYQAISRRVLSVDEKLALFKAQSPEEYAMLCFSFKVQISCVVHITRNNIMCAYCVHLY